MQSVSIRVQSQLGVVPPAAPVQPEAEEALAVRGVHGRAPRAVR